MATKSSKTAHKLGANHKEVARPRPAKDNNFSQSRDIREDRGERQIKSTVRSPQSMPRLSRGR